MSDDIKTASGFQMARDQELRAWDPKRRERRSGLTDAVVERIRRRENRRGKDRIFRWKMSNGVANGRARTYDVLYPALRHFSFAISVVAPKEMPRGLMGMPYYYNPGGGAWLGLEKR